MKNREGKMVAVTGATQDQVKKMSAEYEKELSAARGFREALARTLPRLVG